MLILIHRFSETVAGNISDYPNHTYIHSMTNYIEQNLQDFNIDNMCKEVLISKYYACHLFKRITGMTLMEYVLGKRVSMAKRMLLTTDKTISCIAMDNGFSSAILFCRIFKRVTGSSPLKYRKMFLI
jgi:AraC-like DNA-binding protein